MNQKSLQLRRFWEAMTEDLIHLNLLSIPFSFILGAMTGGLRAPLALLLFIPLLPYHYFLRLRVKKLSLFLTLTWGACLIGLLTPHRVVYTVFIAFMCSYSVRRRTLEESRHRVSFESLAFPLVFLTVLYIASDYLGIPQLREMLYGQAIALVLLSIGYTHLTGINSELELASASTLQPTGTITRFTNTSIMVYIGVFLLVLLLFRFVPFGQVLIAGTSWIIALLRYLFSLIGESDPAAYGSTGTGGGDMAFVPEGEPLPRWMEIIEQVMIYFINILALVAIAAFIIWFCLRLYRGFYRRVSSEGSIIEETRSSIALNKPGKRLKNRLKNPIRRRYYKLVNKHFRRLHLSRALTPVEIEKALRNKEDLRDLTPLYEEARYKDNG